MRIGREVLVPQGTTTASSWNGYGENSRVLARIFGRCQGKAEAGEGRRSGCCHPLGEEGIDTEGLGVTPEAMAKLLEVDVDGWKQHLPQMH